VNRLELIPYDFREIVNIKNNIDNEKKLLLWAGPKYSFPIENVQIENRINSNVDVLSAYSVSEKKIVGFIELEKIANENIGSIQSVLIYETYRGQKYGKVLIGKIIEYGFNTRKYKELRLKLFDNNEIAKRCYESCGFKIFNSIERFGDDGKVLFKLIEMKIENN
jgi:RimJ/RimL family protein N-acetyltransferase